MVGYTMATVAGDEVTAQPVLGHGVAHQEHLAAVAAVALEGLLGGGHRPGLQPADLLLWQK